MTKRNAKAQAPWFSRIAAGAVGIVFVLIWSTLTSVADFFVGRDLLRQLATYGYASAAGTILKSEVASHPGGEDGRQESFDVEYEFLVGDRKQTGERYRFQSSDQRGNARELQRRFPVDSRQTVYFDPADPSRSVLLRGVEGRDLFVPMFLMPFNLVMLAGWSAIFFTWFPRPAHEESGGVPVRDDGLTLRAYVPDNSALFIFFAILFGMSFGMTFVVAFSAGGFDPPLNLMVAVWGLIFAVAIWFAAPRFYRERTGLSDLVIDRFGKRLTLPVTYGRKQPRDVPLDSIESITVKDVCKIDSDGDATHTYHVILREQGNDQDDCVWVASEAAKAKQFLTWLRTSIGILPDSPSKAFKH